MGSILTTILSPFRNSKIMKLNVLTTVVVITGCTSIAMCTSIVMKSYYYNVYIIMDESMFSRFYSCMEDRYTEQCTLILIWNNMGYRTATDVDRTLSPRPLSLTYTCVYDNYNYVYESSTVSCKRSSGQNCQKCSDGSEFTILWDNWYQSFNDTYHQVCQTSWYCKEYRKLTSSSITSVSLTTHTTTPADSTEITAVHLLPEAESTRVDNTELYFTPSVAEAQTKENGSKNETLHSGLQQNVNKDNIIIGTVIGAVLLVMAIIAVFFVCKRCQRVDKTNNAKNVSELTMKSTEPVNLANFISNNINECSNDKYSDNYDQYNSTNCSHENHHTKLSSDHLTYSIAGCIPPNEPNNSSHSTNDKYSDNYDQYNATNSSHENHRSESPSDHLTYSIAGWIPPNESNNASHSNNDTVSDHYDQYTNRKRSEDISGHEMSSDALPYSNTEEMQQDLANQSNKANTVYQNINGNPNNSYSTDYTRLGQKAKVLNHDYNCLIPEGELTSVPVDNGTESMSSPASVYLMSHNISPNVSKVLYAVVNTKN